MKSSASRKTMYKSNTPKCIEQDSILVLNTLPIYRMDICVWVSSSVKVSLERRGEGRGGRGGENVASSGKTERFPWLSHSLWPIVNSPMLKQCCLLARVKRRVPLGRSRALLSELFETCSWFSLASCAVVSFVSSLRHRSLWYWVSTVNKRTVEAEKNGITKRGDLHATEKKELVLFYHSLIEFQVRQHNK